MSDPIYFQWQNEHLLRTIYPLREMKLRDFLVYYYEIDLWAEYKTKSPEDIKPEILAHQAAQERQWTDAYQKFTDLKAYFLTADVSEIYLKLFPEPDQDLLGKINTIHKSFSTYFPGYNDPRRERYFITRQVSLVEKLHQDINKEIANKQRAIRNMGSAWIKTPIYEAEIQKLANITQKMLDEELNRLYDFLAAFDKLAKRRQALTQWFKQMDNQRITNERALPSKQWYVKKYPDKPKYQEELNDLERNIAHIDQEVNRIKNLSEKEQLLTLSENEQITVKDVVRGKVENYREALMLKDHEGLLEDIMRKFLDKPERYPLWLQYMVIHFSGMRYKSAHGSWADPRDLLQSLRISGVERRIKRATDETIEVDCLEKITEYQKILAQTEDQSKRDKIEYHIDGLRSPYPYRRRSTLLDLRIDEENEAIDGQLTDKQVLEELEAMKVQGQLPDWMWKEIVARTDLRLKQATDEKWEDLSPDELEERSAYEARQYRQIMDDWKREHLTGWREEHDRANRLVVTRAVCNEVAEHIQHLRGHTPPGGLTAKPEWYLRNEKNPKPTRSNDIPYLVKPAASEHFKAGASILWLRWVNSQPNAWRIAHPLRLKNGEGLLPGGLVKRYSAGPRKAISKGKAAATQQPGNWTYGKNSRAYQRDRTTFVEQPSDDRRKSAKNKKTKAKTKKVRVNQRQWLRWMHEATVAEVAETADGPVVLTFETALPYEDKRRSTIGVFKHTVNELKYSVSGARFNGSFVGYVPEAELPYLDLREMLDWNKILPKSDIPQVKIRDYWAKVDPMEQETGDFSFSIEVQPPLPSGSPVEVMPPLAKARYRDRIVCYRVDQVKKRAVVYKPRVELGRGLLLFVDKAEPVVIAKRTYHKVIRCDLEPRAQGLYVRESHVLDVPEGQSSKPVEAKDKLNLRKISRGNLKGKPIMDLAGVILPPGTPFRVSTVHKVTREDQGDGVIDADGTMDYYLVIDCPDKSSAKGLFVQTQAVYPLSEEEYIQKFYQARSDSSAPRKLQVRVLPKNDGNDAFLFKEKSIKKSKNGQKTAGKQSKKTGPEIVKSIEHKLPKSAELTVDSTIAVSREKEYYRILECSLNPECVGLFILAKEVQESQVTTGALEDEVKMIRLGRIKDI